MKLVTLKEFAELYFSEISRPTEATLRKCAPPRPGEPDGRDGNYLPGRWVGGRFYVDAHEWEAQDDAIVLSVLGGRGHAAQRTRRGSAA
jgi:hypothetical protein